MSGRGEQGTSTKAPRITGILDIVARFMTSFGGIASGHHSEGLYLNSFLGKIWRCCSICYMDIRKWWKCKGLPVMGAGDVLFYTGSTLNSAQVLPTCSLEGSRYCHHCHLCPTTTSCIDLPQGEDQVLTCPQQHLPWKDSEWFWYLWQDLGQFCLHWDIASPVATQKRQLEVQGS